MNPTAMHERKFTFGEVAARQSVHVHSTYFYICTVFSAKAAADEGYVHHATGSELAFTDAAMLEDPAFREQLALAHLGKLGGELRKAAALFDAALPREPLRAVQ